MENTTKYRVAYGPYGSPPDEKVFLIETNLVETETTGIGGQVDTWIKIGPESIPSHIVLEQSNVDWNGDGDVLDTVSDQLGINNLKDSDTPVADAQGSCVGKRLSGGRISVSQGDGGNIIGGGLLEERNVIGCGAGITAGSGTGVFGNLIGVGTDGVTSIESSEGDGVTFLENNKYGISAAGPGTEIGRVEPGWGDINLQRPNCSG